MQWRMNSRVRNWLIGIGAGLIGPLAWAQGNPAAVVEFSQPSFTASENSRTALVTLWRTGNTNAAVKVDFATADGTARAGVNYKPVRRPVTIPAGKTEAAVSVPILYDFNAEGNQTVRVALSNPGPGVELGPQSTAELVIAMDDKKAKWLSFGLDRVRWLQPLLFGVPLWQYLAACIYVFLAFYAAKLVDLVVSAQLKRWASKTTTRLDDLWLGLLHGPIRVVLFVILLHIGLRFFAGPEWFKQYFSNGLKIAVAISLTYMVLRLVDVLAGFWKDRAVADADRAFAEQLLPIIANSLKVFTIIVAVLLTLQNLDVNITALLASLSIGGLALGLAAQDTLANFFGAIVILVDKPFRIGDQIRIDPVEGTVESIGFRSTRVRTADGHLVTIPNKTVGGAIVANVTTRPQIRTVLNVGIAADTPPDKVRHAVEVLEEVFRRNPRTRDVRVTFNKFADAALNMQVVHLWQGSDGKQHLRDLHELNLQLKDRFEQEGIKLAAPTQTISVKTEGRAGN